MAIQVDIKASQFGVPFTSAYFRIESATVARQRQTAPHKFTVTLDVAGYGTQSPADDTRPVDFQRHHVPLEDIESQSEEEFLGKCYAWLMQQDSMSGSIAV